MHLPQELEVRHYPLRDLGKLAAAFDLDVVLRVGFRPGAGTIRGWLFDTMWTAIRAVNRRFRTVYYWIGTDCYNLLNDIERGARPNWFLRRAMTDHHIAGAPWLAEELARGGINAECVCFPGFGVDPPSEIPPLPEHPTVLTYIPDSRHSFYGSDSIYYAARKLPNVLFYVVGGTGTWVPEPLGNLHFLGWQRDMTQWYARTSIVVRLVQHDAVGGTVREGLAFGRAVVYSYPLPFTETVRIDDRERLVEVLAAHACAVLEGRLTPNVEGRQYAISQFDDWTSCLRLEGYLRRVAT